MDLSELIRNRRCVLAYEDRPVATDLVQELLDVAVWAPNHLLTQPWRFILVQGEGRRRVAEARRLFAEGEARVVGVDEEKRRQRGEAAYTATMAVPAILVVVMAEDARPVVRDEDLIATACVVENFLLLAAERGLGVAVKTYAAGPHAPLREALGIAPGERAVVELQLGYPARVPHARPRVPGRERLTVIETA